jgi:hypothetical protein
MALEKAPPGTNVLDQPVPGTMMVGLFGRSAFASTVIGDMARGKLAGKLRWVDRPAGTFKALDVFGADGQLYPAWVYPDASVPRTTAQGCWPEHHGRIVVQLQQPSSIFTGILRIGYILSSKYPEVVTVGYGRTTRILEVRPGINAGFLPVSGGLISRVRIASLGVTKMCVGDVEVGNILPSTTGIPIP